MMLETATICTEYDIAPISDPERGQRTQDAYLIDRKPLPIDNRVPMASPDHRCTAEDLYTFGLSCEGGITMYCWASQLRLTTRYRGVPVVVSVGNASVASVLGRLLQEATRIDREIGGIRLVPGSSPNA